MDIIVKKEYSTAYKQKAWAQIKQASPETAEAILEITKVFGKPEIIEFTSKG